MCATPPIWDDSPPPPRPAPLSTAKRVTCQRNREQDPHRTRQDLPVLYDGSAPWFPNIGTRPCPPFTRGSGPQLSAVLGNAVGVRPTGRHVPPPKDPPVWRSVRSKLPHDSSRSRGTGRRLRPLGAAPACAPPRPGHIGELRAHRTGRPPRNGLAHSSAHP